MLSPSEISRFYLDSPLEISSSWSLSRKHFRVSLGKGRFAKLNTYENRLTARDVKYYCWKLRPTHVYFSVLNWLFPERVGRECKARYCIPLNGEYVIDVDSYLVLEKHVHRLDNQWNVCQGCLDISKRLTLELCAILELYYRRIVIVFSGRNGFHVHVLDFDYRDWVSYRERDPIWCHHAARFKFTKLLQKQTHVFDRRHFTVSVDPMRVVTIPNTLNAETGLVCSFIGDRKELERLTIQNMLEKSKEYDRFHSYPEPLESCSSFGENCNGAMKLCAKNIVEPTWEG